MIVMSKPKFLRLPVVSAGAEYLVMGYLSDGLTPLAL